MSALVQGEAGLHHVLVDEPHHTNLYEEMRMEDRKMISTSWGSRASALKVSFVNILMPWPAKLPKQNDCVGWWPQLPSIWLIKLAYANGASKNRSDNGICSSSRLIASTTGR